MSDVPFVDADADVSGEAVDRARNLLPWLPDPYRCPDCGEYCEATRVYSSELMDVVDAWECPNEECGGRWYRERY